MKDQNEWECVGSVGLTRSLLINSKICVEIGYFLGEKYWGKGIMTEAVKLATEYAFSDTYKNVVNEGIPVVRLFAVTFAHNKTSARVLEKNGYELECVQRKCYIKEGKILDGLSYVKLRPNT